VVRRLILINYVIMSPPAGRGRERTVNDQVDSNAPAT